MIKKGQTSQRTILFRQNINRSNEEWAHFLEGFRAWLMDYDMNEFGDDWHTAEDIVSEIYLIIIREPLITNKRPQDTFRHTLIGLCKHMHQAVTKPWRKALSDKLCDVLKLNRLTHNDILFEIALGFYDLTKADLMDRSRDGGRSYKTFSEEDLKRWRTLHGAGDEMKIKDAAKIAKVDRSAFGRSCKKVEDDIIETVKTIMRRKGFGN